MKAFTAAHRAALSRALKGRVISAEHRRHLSEARTRTHCARGHALTPENTYSRKTGRRSCKTCHKVAGAAKYLLKQYGITPDALKGLREQQHNLCLLCGEQFSDHVGDLKPVIDHDHSCCQAAPVCGKCIRGLIHDVCNRSIGLFGDDPSRLRRAADYLEGRHGKPSGISA